MGNQTNFILRKRMMKSYNLMMVAMMAIFMMLVLLDTAEAFQFDLTGFTDTANAESSTEYSNAGEWNQVSVLLRLKASKNLIVRKPKQERSNMAKIFKTLKV